MPKTKRQERSIDDVYNLLAEVKEQIALNQHYFPMIDKLSESIKGNGKAGLETRVTLAEEREQKRDRREWFIYTVLFAEMAALIFTMVTS